MHKLLIKFGSYLFLAKFGYILFWLYLITIFSSEEIGVISIYNFSLSFFSAFIGAGMHVSYQRNFVDWQSNYDLRKSALWFVSKMSSLLLASCFYIFLFFFSHLVFKSKLDLLFISVLCVSIFLNSSKDFVFCHLRIKGKVDSIGIIMLCQSLVQILMVSLFIKLNFSNSNSFILGTTISCFVVFTFSFKMFYCQNMIKGIQLIINDINFGIKSCPAILLNSVYSFADRYILERYIPLSDFGNYCILKNLTGYFGLFNQVLKSVWIPNYFRFYKEGLLDKMHKYSFSYVKIISLLSVFFTYILYFVFIYLKNGEYIESLSYIPLFVFLLVFQSYLIAYGRGPDIIKKPIIDFYILLLSVVVLIFCYYIFIDKYLIFGVLVSLYISTLIRFFIVFRITNNVLSRSVNLLPLLVSPIFYFTLTYFPLLYFLK